MTVEKSKCFSESRSVLKIWWFWKFLLPLQVLEKLASFQFRCNKYFVEEVRARIMNRFPKLFYSICKCFSITLTFYAETSQGSEAFCPKRQFRRRFTSASTSTKDSKKMSNPLRRPVGLYNCRADCNYRRKRFCKAFGARNNPCSRWLRSRLQWFQPRPFACNGLCPLRSELWDSLKRKLGKKWVVLPAEWP